MTKKQKIWLWIFIAMFAVPEILFFTTLSLANNFYSGEDFLTLHSPFVNSIFFIIYPVAFYIVMILEIAGILGLIGKSMELKKKIFLPLLNNCFIMVAFYSFLGVRI